MAVSQLLGLAFNVLMAPFNILANPLGASACNPLLLKMGENELKVSLAPRGYCPNCCPVRTGIDLRFVLYNRQHQDRGVPIEISNRPGAARRAGVDPEAATIFFIHGFTEPSPGESGRAIVDAYLSRNEPVNVILIDWSNLASFPWYRPAVRNVKIVAEALTNFLQISNDSGEIPMQKVHIIGFSLGSHIASFTGKRLRRGLRLPRITALDPALPEYSLRDTSRRLTRTDADYVDVIHTDAGVLGLPIPVGHADFYPNGGKALQPGCQPSYLVQTRLIDQVLACSHVRAWRLYAESVRNPEAFPATKCRLWRGTNKICNFTVDAILGYGSANNTEGQFYLITGYKTPYSKTALQQST